MVLILLYSILNPPTGTVAAVAEAAVAVVPPTMAAEELVAAAITEAEARRTATPLATHTVAMRPPQDRRDPPHQED
jgi:hypothetical protein